ncbi:hypothetical protein GGR77_003990 [Xanthomonas translucens]
MCAALRVFPRHGRRFGREPGKSKAKATTTTAEPATMVGGTAMETLRLHRIDAAAIAKPRARAVRINLLFKCSRIGA